MKILKPIFLFFIYSFFSISMFFWGPIKFSIKNVEELVYFLITCHFFLFFGYLFSSLKLRVVGVRKLSYNSKIINVILVTKLCIVFSCVISFLILIKVTNGHVIDFVVTGLLDPKSSYMLVREVEKESSLITQIQTLFAPIVLSSFSLGCFYFNKLSTKFKFLFLVSIVFFVLAYVSKGTNFGVFVGIITVVTTYLMKLKLLGSNKAVGINRGLLLVGLIFLFFVFYFLYTITSRLGYDYIPSVFVGQPVDKNHVLFFVFPDLLSIPILTGLSYLIQGYYGLSLVFDYPFTFSYGLGIGRFVISKFQFLTDLDLWHTTYHSKMDNIWDSELRWHTSYSWLANAFSVYGVPIYLFLIGIITNLIYKSYCYLRSSIAVSLYPIYVIMFFFFPANNVIYNNPIVFMPFIVLTFLFLTFTRVKYVSYD